MKPLTLPPLSRRAPPSLYERGILVHLARRQRPQPLQTRQVPAARHAASEPVAVRPPRDQRQEAAARLLVATGNPQALVGLAQLALPDLAAVAIPTDGTPVALPAGIIPNASGYLPQLSVAMDGKALALASGDGDLRAYLAAPAASDGQLIRFAFTGGFYSMLGDLIGRVETLMPSGQPSDLARQRELYALYARWIRLSDLRINATPKGLEFVQSIELAP